MLPTQYTAAMDALLTNSTCVEYFVIKVNVWVRTPANQRFIPRRQSQGTFSVLTLRAARLYFTVCHSTCWSVYLSVANFASLQNNKIPVSKTVFIYAFVGHRINRNDCYGPANWRADRWMDERSDLWLKEVVSIESVFLCVRSTLMVASLQRISSWNIFYI